MHMHCCFVYTVVLAVVFLYAEVVILFIPRGTSLRFISISIFNLNLYFFPQKPRIRPTSTCHAPQRLQDSLW